jgi:hypothetical protein
LIVKLYPNKFFLPYKFCWEFILSGFFSKFACLLEEGRPPPGQAAREWLADPVRLMFPANPAIKNARGTYELLGASIFYGIRIAQWFDKYPIRKPSEFYPPWLRKSPAAALTRLIWLVGGAELASRSMQFYERNFFYYSFPFIRGH